MLTITNGNQRHNNEMMKQSSRKQKENVSYTVIGIDSERSAVLKDKDPCPCCNRQLRCRTEHRVVGETVLNPSRYDNLFQIHSKTSDNSKEKDLDKLDRMLPGVLAEGIAYTVKSVIAQGYIDKKGSGFDWIGSRAWKARWAVLVVRMNGDFFS